MRRADNTSQNKTLILVDVGEMQMEKGAEGGARKSFSEWLI